MPARAMFPVRWILILLIALFCLGCQPSARVLTPEVTQEEEFRPPASPPTPIPDPDLYADERARMVREQIQARGVIDEAVLAAMLAVPRHLFVPDEYLDRAYADHPLPIGYGQTISQPYIVALMSVSLRVATGSRVLEIGTGSGYQAAVLAEMGMEVYSIEIIPELAALAEAQLAEAGYGGVSIQNADGYFGWEEQAPFDAIIVTAAPDHLPQPLVAQLVEGGNLVIPIGPIGALQSLWLFTKVGGELEATNLGAVRFVPFTRASD